MTFADEIERAAGGEPIIAAVIGHYGHEDSDGPHDPMPWIDARELLDYDWRGGFGDLDCHAVYVWTDSRVIFVDEYDTSTSLAWVPRHPQRCDPSMNGEDLIT